MSEEKITSKDVLEDLKRGAEEEALEAKKRKEQIKKVIDEARPSTPEENIERGLKQAEHRVGEPIDIALSDKQAAAQGDMFKRAQQGNRAEGWVKRWSTLLDTASSLSGRRRSWLEPVIENILYETQDLLPDEVGMALDRVRELPIDFNKDGSIKSRFGDYTAQRTFLRDLEDRLYSRGKSREVSYAARTNVVADIGANIYDKGREITSAPGWKGGLDDLIAALNGNDEFMAAQKKKLDEGDLSYSYLRGLVDSGAADVFNTKKRSASSASETLRSDLMKRARKNPESTRLEAINSGVLSSPDQEAVLAVVARELQWRESHADLPTARQNIKNFIADSEFYKSTDAAGRRALEKAWTKGEDLLDTRISEAIENDKTFDFTGVAQKIADEVFPPEERERFIDTHSVYAKGSVVLRSDKEKRIEKIIDTTLLGQGNDGGPLDFTTLQVKTEYIDAEWIGIGHGIPRPAEHFEKRQDHRLFRLYRKTRLDILDDVEKQLTYHLTQEPISLSGAQRASNALRKVEREFDAIAQPHLDRALKIVGDWGKAKVGQLKRESAEAGQRGETGARGEKGEAGVKLPQENLYAQESLGKGEVNRPSISLRRGLKVNTSSARRGDTSGNENRSLIDGVNDFWQMWPWNPDQHEAITNTWGLQFKYLTSQGGNDVYKSEWSMPPRWITDAWLGDEISANYHLHGNDTDIPTRLGAGIIARAAALTNPQWRHRPSTTLGLDWLSDDGDWVVDTSVSMPEHPKHIEQQLESLVYTRGLNHREVTTGLLREYGLPLGNFMGGSLREYPWKVSPIGAVDLKGFVEDYKEYKAAGKDAAALRQTRLGKVMAAVGINFDTPIQGRFGEQSRGPDGNPYTEADAFLQAQKRIHILRHKMNPRGVELLNLRPSEILRYDTNDPLLLGALENRFNYYARRASAPDQPIIRGKERGTGRPSIFPKKVAGAGGPFWGHPPLGQINARQNPIWHRKLLEYDRLDHAEMTKGNSK